MRQIDEGNGLPERLAVPTADQVFMELQLVSRRLRSVQRLIGPLAVSEAGPEWAELQEHCQVALGALSVAGSMVPDALPEHERTSRVLVVRDLTVDQHAHRAWFGEQELELAGLEFGLLGALAIDPLRVRSKQELLRSVWGYRGTPRTRTVDSHASRLRRKLIDAGAGGHEWVVNQWGVGYALLRPAEISGEVPR